MRYGAAYDPQTEILVTPGAKQGLMYLMEALIDPGDEAVLFEPCWLNRFVRLSLTQDQEQLALAADRLKSIGA